MLTDAVRGQVVGKQVLHGMAPGVGSIHVAFNHMPATAMGSVSHFEME